MSIESEARAEAEKLMDEARERVGLTVREQQRYIEGYIAGASRPVSDEREAVRGALVNVLCNASNFPEKVQARLLGQDMNPLIEKTVDAVIAVNFQRPVTDEQVEAAARAYYEASERELWEPGDPIVDWDTATRSQFMWAARIVLEAAREARA